MIREIMKNSLVGLIFGFIIALIAYFGGFQIPAHYIFAIPVFMALLNMLGSLAAVVVVTYLAMKNLMNEKNLNIVGFVVAAAVNTLLAFLVILQLDDNLLHQELIFLYFIGMAMGAVYGIIRYRIQMVNERIRFLEEIAEKNRQLQEATRQLAITHERNRMGRELHDSISQGLHGLNFAIHSLRNQLQDPSEAVQHTLNHMEATARSTQDELRTMIEALKPSILAEKGLAEALETISGLFSQRQSIPVQVHLQMPDYIAPKIEMAIYRIAQEALSNIERHASARKVSLELSSSGEQILFNIKDDGKGFNVHAMSPGHGLRNMRLRAEEAGGTLTLVSNPSLGTSIVAAFPQGT